MLEFSLLACVWAVATARYSARPIGHSAGRKVAGNTIFWECCRADTHPCRTRREADRQQTRTVAFCYPSRWLTLIPRCDRPVVGPSALRRTPPALWPMTYFDESLGPVGITCSTSRCAPAEPPRAGTDRL